MHGGVYRMLGLVVSLPVVRSGERLVTAVAGKALQIGGRRRLDVTGGGRRAPTVAIHGWDRAGWEARRLRGMGRIMGVRVLGSGIRSLLVMSDVLRAGHGLGTVCSILLSTSGGAHRAINGHLV